MDIRKMNAIEFLASPDDYIIPFYQRDYSWGKKEIQQLLNDIWNNQNKSYYLGNIVLKKTHFEVIVVDGQQRITSILLLIKEISVMESLSDRELDKIKMILNSSYSRRLDVRSNTMQKILQGKTLTEEDKNTNYYLNLLEIKKFFIGKDTSVLLEKIFRVDFAYIGLDSDVDEHVIFSQINSTGKPLTAFDLTKNYYFSRLSEDILELKLEEITYATKLLSEAQKDNMLRHFIAFNNGELVKKDTKEIYKAIKELNGSDEDIVKQLIQFSEIYSRLWIQDKSMGVTIPKILHNSFNTFAVLLVEIVVKHSTFNCGSLIITNEKEVKNCFSILEAYKVRREFVSLKEKEITRFIPRIVQNIRAVEEVNYSEAVVDILLVEANYQGKPMGYRMPTKEEYSEAFYLAPIYNEPKFTKLLLERLEKYGTKEDTDMKSFSIEHIMPQTLTAEWEDYLSDDIKNYHKYLHTIGNLTLTADNSKLSNHLFEDKREILQNKSRIKLNNKLMDYSSWSSVEIVHRAEELLELSNKIWNPEKYTNKDMRYITLLNDFDNESPYITYEKNRRHFDKLRPIQKKQVEALLSNSAVRGFSTSKNEKEVFGIECDGWVSQSIIKGIGESAKTLKGQYSEDQFKSYLIDNSDKVESLIKKINNDLY